MTARGGAECALSPPRRSRAGWGRVLAAGSVPGRRVCDRALQGGGGQGRRARQGAPPMEWDAEGCAAEEERARWWPLCVCGPLGDTNARWCLLWPARAGGPGRVLPGWARVRSESRGSRGAFHCRRGGRGRQRLPGAWDRLRERCVETGTAARSRCASRCSQKCTRAPTEMWRCPVAPRALLESERRDGGGGVVLSSACEGWGVAASAEQAMELFKKAAVLGAEEGTARYEALAAK